MTSGGTGHFTANPPAAAAPAADQPQVDQFGIPALPDWTQAYLGGPNQVVPPEAGFTALGAVPGSFDPALQAQLLQSRRGLAQLYQDTAIKLQQGKIDTATAIRTLRQAAARSNQDILLAQGRGQQDIATKRATVDRNLGRSVFDIARQTERTTADRGTAVGLIDRRYANLARQQGEAARSQNVAEGGTLAAAAKARAGNQALETAPIDTAYGRFMQDAATRGERNQQDAAAANTGLDVAAGRLNENTSLGLGRTAQDLASQNRLALRANQRAAAQLGLAFDRGTQEQQAYTGDIAQEEAYQAYQANPTGPIPPLLAGTVAPTLGTGATAPATSYNTAGQGGGGQGGGGSGQGGGQNQGQGNNRRRRNRNQQ